MSPVQAPLAEPRSSPASCAASIEGSQKLPGPGRSDQPRAGWDLPPARDLPPTERRPAVATLRLGRTRWRLARDPARDASQESVPDRLIGHARPPPSAPTPARLVASARAPGAPPTVRSSFLATSVMLTTPYLSHASRGVPGEELVLVLPHSTTWTPVSSMAPGSCRGGIAPPMQAAHRPQDVSGIRGRNGERRASLPPAPVLRGGRSAFHLDGV